MSLSAFYLKFPLSSKVKAQDCIVKARGHFWSVIKLSSLLMLSFFLFLRINNVQSRQQILFGLK